MSKEVNKELLSIIVPLFNAEKYIEKCLVSLCNQTYQNIEIIVVDDGSFDNGKQIVKNYMEEHDNISLIEQENSGVSKARNVGMYAARGEFITFVDADDYLETNVYSVVMQKMLAEDVDGVLYAFERIFSSGKKEFSPLPWENGTILFSKEIRSELIPFMIARENGTNTVSGSVCRTVFKRAVIENYCFDENIRIQEDLIYCINTYANMNRILILNEVKYYYIRHAGTTIERYRKNYYSESTKYEEAIVASLENNNLFHALQDRYFGKRMKTYSLCISNLFRSDAPKCVKNELKEIIDGFNSDTYMKQGCGNQYVDFNMKILYWLMALKMSSIIKWIYSAKEKKRQKSLAE